jgi:hypothetical protein
VRLTYKNIRSLCKNDDYETKLELLKSAWDIFQLLISFSTIIIYILDGWRFLNFIKLHLNQEDENQYPEGSKQNSLT